jgi:hypothetical protein
VWLEGFMSIEKSNDLIGNVTRDLRLVARCLNQLRYHVPSGIESVQSKYVIKYMPSKALSELL